MPGTNKQSQAIIEQRIAKIMPMISFMSVQEIFRYISEKENWGVTKRTVENYVAQAKLLLKNEFQEYKKNAFENTYNNYVMLFKKAMQKNDTKLCLQIQDSMAKIFGLTQKLDITTGGQALTGFTVKVSDDDE